MLVVCNVGVVHKNLMRNMTIRFLVEIHFTLLLNHRYVRIWTNMSTTVNILDKIKIQIITKHVVVKL